MEVIMKSSWIMTILMVIMASFCLAQTPREAQLSTGTLRTQSIRVTEGIRFLRYDITAQPGQRYWLVLRAPNGETTSTVALTVPPQGAGLSFMVGKRQIDSTTYTTTLYGLIDDQTTGSAEVLVKDGGRLRAPRTLDALMLDKGSEARTSEFIARMDAHWKKAGKTKPERNELLNDWRRVTLKFALDEQLDEAQRQLDARRKAAEEAAANAANETPPVSP
jgi:hypothetical protein